MPVVCIVINKEVGFDAKKALSKALTELVASECRVPGTHVHVLITDNQFFSFGSDFERPAIYVTVKSSAQQIVPEARRKMVAELIPLLRATLPDLDPYRVNTMFEELPVENIAVGANIATFASGGGGSNRNSLGGAGAS